MGYCPNCKSTLTCGCQKRVSTDGKVGCANCINALNASAKTQTTKTVTSGTAPTGVAVAYAGPGRKLDDL